MKTIDVLLKVNQATQEGDEYLESGEWIKIQAFAPVREGEIIRRRMNVAELNETLYQKVGHDKGKYSYQPIEYSVVEQATVYFQQKRIVELEGANANLKTHNDNQSGLIQRLEKEITELKKENDSYKNRWMCNLDVLSDKLKEIEQLKESQGVKWEKSRFVDGAVKEPFLSIDCKNVQVYVNDWCCKIPLPPENGGAASRIWELEKLKVQAEKIERLEEENKYLRSTIDTWKLVTKKLEIEIEQLRKSQIVWLDETGGSWDERTHFILHRNGRTAIVPLPPADVDPAEEAWEEHCKRNGLSLNYEGKQDYIAGFRAAQAKTNEAV